MKFKYKFMLLLISLSLAGCLYISQSYAIWVIKKEQVGENEVSAGCFSVGFEEGAPSINLTNTFPVIDELGLNSEPYQFTITNTCTINSNYIITLNTLDTNTISADNIKYAIYKEGSSKPTTGSELTEINNEIGNLNIANLDTSYVIGSGILKGGTKNEEGQIVTGGDSATYNLYIWIADKAENDLMGKTFEASINIINNATTKDKAQVSIDNINARIFEEKEQAEQEKENPELIYDDTEDRNLRYIGSNPNNYIDIGDRDGTGQPILWRIIGVMNRVTSLDNGERSESLIKIVRSSSIGSYSWDSSPNTVNAGYGVNEWSQADLMKLLNPKEIYNNEEPEYGGSLYWDNLAGRCYASINDSTNTCDFTSSGLSDAAKSKIAKVRWNTGTFATYDTSEWTASNTYLAERGSHNGKEFCSSQSSISNYCKDEVERKTTWDGYVGLMHPSDFGYAVGKTIRSTCLTKSMNKYNEDGCKDDDWLKTSSTSEWVLNPISNTTGANIAFTLSSYNGLQGGYRSTYSYAIRPVVYLKSSVTISETQGATEPGTTGNPYVAS